MIYLIGPARTIEGVWISTPEGQEIPNPFTMRYVDAPELGRTIAGGTARGTYESIDWVYNITGGALVKKFFNYYNPSNPWVWIYFLDRYTDAGRWFRAVMLEPHVERGAGSTITGLFVSFKQLQPY